MDPRGKTVIVTGASSGIGKEVAKQFAQAGANLVLVARQRQRLEQLAEELGGVAPCLVAPADIQDRWTVQAMAERAAHEFGSIDVLVNNAGLGLIAPIAEGDPENMRQMFEVNLWGAINCIQAVIPYMRQQKQGQIINISSLAGKIATPYLGLYSASKFALTALSDALRLELAADGIQVITVYPGLTDTPFVEHAIREVEPLPPPPLLRRVPAREVAQRILQASCWGQRDVYITWEDFMAVATRNVAPWLVDWGLRQFWLFSRVAPQAGSD